MEIEVKNPSTVQVLAVTEKDIEILKKQYDMFRLLQQRVLEEGIDYGYPAGRRDPSQKPSLYKSGAEKLTRLFNLTSAFELVKAEEREDYVYYMFRCILKTRDGFQIGEGYGLANSKEKKHWNADPLANANTILKMAKKRAHVDAVLTGLGASNVFTQDLEDVEPPEPEKQAEKQPEKQVELATEKQLKMIGRLISEVAKAAECSVEEVVADIKRRYGVQSSTELTKSQASQLINELQETLSSINEGGKHDEH